MTIYGAARQVTGSMHLLEVNDYKILIDCGLDYENRSSLSENDDFPFNPMDIDVVVLTHAHIDHSGNLPTLVRKGFSGQILCTSPTAELSELLMLDSVNIFLRKEKQKVKRGKRSFIRYNPPLYLQRHVMETVDRFVTLPFNKAFQINSHIQLTLIPAGHLLGAASAVFHVIEGERQKSIAFTGDLGRFDYPTLQDPAPLPVVDYLVSESTYGGRRHRDHHAEEVLLETIRNTCVASKGKLIIPAFSVGRTQALIYLLNKVFSDGTIPKIKIFVDSPMANHATEVYRKHHLLLNEEARDFYSLKEDEFEFENLTYIENMDESKEVSNYYDPCIIISSAGMLEGGRIQDHLYENLQNYYCTILFIGYCAKGTLGHRLLRGDPIIRLRNRDLYVYAGIKRTDALSGHADHDGLLEHIKSQSPSTLKNIFLVHGEQGSMEALKKDLELNGFQVMMPEKGETLVL